MKYYVLIEKTKKFFEVEGWDEIEKFVRDHSSLQFKIFGPNHSVDIQHVKDAAADGSFVPGDTQESDTALQKVGPSKPIVIV